MVWRTIYAVVVAGAAQKYFFISKQRLPLPANVAKNFQKAAIGCIHLKIITQAV
jgi:hypothetical protein